MSWKPVKGYEGKYEVSTDGEIRKVDGTVIGQWRHSQGYMLARLSGPRAQVRVHRVVAEAFIPNPSDAPSINHIDCDRANNDYRNLEWCTQAQNMAHMDKLGRRPRFWLGKRSPNARLSDKDVAELRRTHSEDGLSLSKLADKFGISKRSAHRCVKGEAYRNLFSLPEPPQSQAEAEKQ